MATAAIIFENNVLKQAKIYQGHWRVQRKFRRSTGTAVRDYEKNIQLHIKRNSKAFIKMS